MDWKFLSDMGRQHRERDFRLGFLSTVTNQVIHFWGFRSIVFAFLAIFLVWEVTTRSLVAYLAETAPDTAIRLGSTHSTPLLNLADGKLNRQQLPKNGEPTNTDSIGLRQDADPQADIEIQSWAEVALFNDPLNARALRILGQLAEKNSDEERAERLMQGAVRRSLRESVAVYWLMQKSYDKQDYGAAVRYADALLRTRPQIIAQVMPTLAAIAEHKDASDELKKLLADNPPWRGQFFQHLPAKISDARTPLDLFLSLKDTPNPPALSDLQGYLHFLIGHKFHELAYYTWLQFLPSEQLGNTGLLFNGSFEVAPSGLPFDWVVMSGSGVTIEVATRPEQDEERALFIEFGHGRVDFRGVTQMTMLAPGRYRFQGKYKGEIIGRRGLLWRVTCVGGATPAIGQSPMVIGVAPTWKDFEFSFTVPATDCRAQIVRLVFDARSESEQFVSGSVWYDDLRIVRADKIVAQ